MKQLLKEFLVIFILFFQVQFVNAEICSVSKINSLKELANLILIDSEFDYDGIQDGIYDNNIVTVQNLSEDLYIMSKEENVAFFPEDISDGMIIQGVSSLDNVFYVYSSECSDVKLRTINLSLKKFNMYSEFEECDGIEEGELDVCNQFADVYVNYDGFLKKVNEYKEKKGVLSDGTEGPSKKNYLLVIALVTFIIVSVIVALIIRTRKRSKLD